MTIEVEDQTGVVETVKQVSAQLVELLEQVPGKKVKNTEIAAEALTALAMATATLLLKHNIDDENYDAQLHGFLDRMSGRVGENGVTMMIHAPHNIDCRCFSVPTSQAHEDTGYDYINLAFLTQEGPERRETFLGAMVVKARSFAKAVEHAKKLGVVETFGIPRAAIGVSGATIPAHTPPPDGVLDVLVDAETSQRNHATWHELDSKAMAQ
jgi:hypothetical protein